MTQEWAGAGVGERPQRGISQPGGQEDFLEAKMSELKPEVVARDDVIRRQCLPVLGHGEELGFLPRVLGSHGRPRAEV